jgi:hypothetical protein
MTVCLESFDAKKRKRRKTYMGSYRISIIKEHLELGRLWLRKASIIRKKQCRTKCTVYRIVINPMFRSIKSNCKREKYILKTKLKMNMRSYMMIRD